MAATALAAVLLVLLCLAQPASGEEVWTRWGDRALRACHKTIKGRPGRWSRLDTICDNFQDVVEEEFRLLAINAGAALGHKEAEANVKFTDELAERMERAPYRPDGDRIIAETALHFVEQGVSSPKEMKQYFFTRFAQWLMNAAVNNGKSLDSMPAYPNMADLEKSMHSEEL